MTNPIVTLQETPEHEPKPVPFQVQPRRFVFSDLVALLALLACHMADAVVLFARGVYDFVTGHAEYRHRRKDEKQLVRDVTRYVAAHA